MGEKTPRKPERAWFPDDVFFILSMEISFIYSKKRKVRKIHILLLAPDFESVEKINNRLTGLGNLRSASPRSSPISHPGQTR